MKRAIRTALIFLLLSVIVIEGLIIYHAKPDEAEDIDYVIVLGCELKGEQPSLTLQERLDVALDFLKSHPAVSAVVSGGQGQGEAISEALAMKCYLVQQGISEERIVVEDKSTSTIENLRFSKLTMMEFNEPPRKKILIITNEFHLFRAKFLARRLGFTPYGLPSKTLWYLVPKYYVREYFAVLKSALLDW